MLRYIHIYVVSFLLFSFCAADLIRSDGRFESAPATHTTANVNGEAANAAAPRPTRIFYGQASYYASKFEGRKTATGEIFRHSKLTAACNFLPLGTWIKITNLKNGRTIFAKTNDRLHTKTRRIIDLTKSGAKKLGYLNNGLTRVKVEVLKKKPV